MLSKILEFVNSLIELLKSLLAKKEEKKQEVIYKEVEKEVDNSEIDKLNKRWNDVNF